MEQIIQTISGWVWSPALVACCLLAGLYFAATLLDGQEPEDRHHLVSGFLHGPFGARGYGKHCRSSYGHWLRRPWGYRLDVDYRFFGCGFGLL